MGAQQCGAGSAILVACVLASSSALAQDVQFVAGSTTPRMQLTGEDFQISSNDTYFITPTPARTRTRSGVIGTDLGYPVTYGDKIFLLFGDTMGAYESGGKHYVSRGDKGAGDSIGYIPADVDLDQCRYIGDVEAELARGVRSPTVAPGACPAIRFYNDPVRAPEGHVFKPIIISGLLPDESASTFRVPSAGLIYNDRLYMFFGTRIQEAGEAGHFPLQSIVARSDQSPGSWSDSVPPTFTRLYTVSSHAEVADITNPPAADGDGGRFIFNPVVVMDAATIAAAGLRSGLPAALQNADQVAFVWGSSWRGNTSNLYLAAFSLPDIDVGPSKWFYFAGDRRWSASETDAAPLLPADDVANHSVVWNSALRRFVMMGNSSGRIRAHFSTTPWGPWSTPTTVFTRNDPWFNKLMHRPGLDQMVQSAVPIYNKDGSLFATPDGDPGVPYAPNLLDKFTRNVDGSITVYYTLSTWNPYQVFLVSSRFRIGAGPAASINAATLERLDAGPSLSSVTVEPGGQGESTLLLYGTGLRHQRGLAATRVAVGGVSSAIVDAAASPGDRELDWIRVRVPSGLSPLPRLRWTKAGRAEVEVVVVVNDRAADPVRVAIK